MNVWKWFGWNDKEARIKMNENNNWHSTVQTVFICIVLAVGLSSCAVVM